MAATAATLTLFPIEVPLPDICRGKHGGNDASEQANIRVAPVKALAREQVYEAVERTGSFGLTLTEYVASENDRRRRLRQRDMMAANEVSGRFTELADEEHRILRLIVNGKRVLRNGAGVWVAAKFAYLVTGGAQ